MRVVTHLNNQGTQFQLLVGPAFIYTFASAAMVFGLLLDRFNRPLLTGIGRRKKLITVDTSSLAKTLSSLNSLLSQVVKLTFEEAKSRQ